MKKLPVLLALLAATSFACGSESETEADHGHQHGGGGEHDHYTPGMQRLTEDGLYEVTLYSDPGPPEMGLNVFTLGLADAAGAPVTGATVTVVPFMTAHGHGSDRDPVVTEEVDSPGTYTATDVSLTMLGVWDLEIGVDGAEGSDVVHFRFDVQ
ncbi:FixH family protein [Vulgatibacter sp.]|uniref:FixH family protein n=1 Tax=Vulgatibacter sp. TaxID=1971226 RepID=UPI0035668E35